MQKLITFGVAVYNVEQYLKDCLDSIVSQKGDDIEILLVDDGSEDSSGKICDEYAKIDSRIRVIHKENGGVSTARNAIISEACGEWISFVDGDDALDKNAAETVRKYAHKRFDIINFDVVYFRFIDTVSKYKNDMEPDIITGDDIYDLAKSTIYYTDAEKRRYVNRTVYAVWGKIYRTDFLHSNNLMFDTQMLKAQDMDFNLRNLVFTENIKLVRNAFYQYRNNAFAITKRYNEKIEQYDRILIDKIKKDILLYDESLHRDMIERLNMLHLVSLKTEFILNVFHKDNPKSKSERKADFERLLKGYHSEAVKNCDKSLLIADDKKFYKLITECDFNKIDRHFRRKDLTEKFKIWVNRTGLIQIYKFILRKN